MNCGTEFFEECHENILCNSEQGLLENFQTSVPAFRTVALVEISEFFRVILLHFKEKTRELRIDKTLSF